MLPPSLSIKCKSWNDFEAFLQKQAAFKNRFQKIVGPFSGPIYPQKTREFKKSVEQSGFVHVRCIGKSLRFFKKFPGRYFKIWKTFGGKMQFSVRRTEFKGVARAKELVRKKNKHILDTFAGWGNRRAEYEVRRKKMVAYNACAHFFSLSKN